MVEAGSTNAMIRGIMPVARPKLSVVSKENQVIRFRFDGDNFPVRTEA